MTLDAWIDVLRDVMEQKPWAWTIFLVYVILTSFVVTNLLIATICESTSDLVENHDLEEEEKNRSIDREMKKLQLSLHEMHQDIRTKLGMDAKDYYSERTSQLWLSDDKLVGSDETMGNNDNNDMSIHTTLRDTLVGEAPSNSQEITKPQGPLANFRFKCGLFINHDYTQLFIMALIVSNSLLMVVATYDFSDGNSDGDSASEDENNTSVQDIFNYIDQVFLAIFTLETVLQLIYHGWKLFTDPWLVFDFVLVVTSWPLSEFVALRAFRVARIIRLFPKIKSLRDLVETLAKSLQGLTGVFWMLVIIFYTFAVVFTVLFKDEDLSEGYEGFFDRLDKSFLTLFQIMTVRI